MPLQSCFVPRSIIIFAALGTGLSSCGPSRPPASEEALQQALYCFQLGTERATWLGRQRGQEMEAERTRQAALAHMAFAQTQAEGLSISENAIDQRILAIQTELRALYPDARERSWQSCEFDREERTRRT